MDQFFKPKPPGYKPPPPTVVAKRNTKRKRVAVSLAIFEEKLEGIQSLYGGTAEEALSKFLDSQLCKQSEIESVKVKRYVQLKR